MIIKIFFKMLNSFISLLIVFPLIGVVCLFFYWASIFNINHKVLCDDDTCPGRLNQVSIFIKRDGVFFGQYSELCGVNHGFMPIVVESVPIDNYIKWVLLQTECNNWFSSSSTWFYHNDTKI